MNLSPSKTSVSMTASVPVRCRLHTHVLCVCLTHAADSFEGVQFSQRRMHGHSVAIYENMLC